MRKKERDFVSYEQPNKARLAILILEKKYQKQFKEKKEESDVLYCTKKGEFIKKLYNYKHVFIKQQSPQNI